MTPAEYVQLKAFARQDGAYLSVLWIASFASYIMGINHPWYSVAALFLMVVTPFFVGRRLRRFRDEDRDGVISLLRGWAYAILVFFYAGILLAVVQYVYFAFIDHGYLVSSFMSAMSSTEGKQMIEMYGMQQTMEESLDMMAKMRPIDYALNILTVNISIGIVMGLPIAALMQRSVAHAQQNNQQQ